MSYTPEKRDGFLNMRKRLLQHRTYFRNSSKLAAKPMLR